MKILFGTCTCGGGHLTQAIAMKEHCLKRNHTVCGVLSPKNNKNNLPEYFTKEFNVKEFKGFDFIFDSSGRVIVWKTIVKTLLDLPFLFYSFYQICEYIKKEKPDAIFNFYEPLVGLTSLFFPNIKYISIGHQYAMTTKNYPKKIDGFRIQKLFLGIINKVTSIRATRVALSYYQFMDDNNIICPPILRSQSYSKSDVKENFILVYLMSEGLLPQLINESKKYPNVKIECFSRFTKEHIVPSNVKLFNLNGKLFQERMKVCSSVVCSGGFETSAEAMYQQKPLLMVPMPNHFEQTANCNDAVFHGLASSSQKIDLTKVPKSTIDSSKWFEMVDPILDYVFNSTNS
jgi:uncharacterized protein (TIGR00661 family)